MERSEIIQRCSKRLHDLNNQLGVISGYGSILQGDITANNRQEQYLNTIINTLLHAGDIVQEVSGLLKNLAEID